MSTQKHLVFIASISLLFVVLIGDVAAKSIPAHHKITKHKSHNTTLEKKSTSNKRIKHKNNSQPHKSHLHNVVSHESHLSNSRKMVGIASYYGYESGKITAMGTRFNPLGLTAAHKTIPLSSKVKVTNLKNNKSIIVTINDRGPYVRGRMLDLSLGAARAIKLDGVGKVSIEIL
jgi:rare lipoprotein A (peptidoglycan hydrolase)